MSSPQLSPEISSPVPSTPSDRFSTKRFRTLELILVLAVAFTGPVLLSLMVAGGAMTYELDADKARIAIGIANEVIGLCVLAYVLTRQGRNFQTVLDRFRWQDIPWSMALMAAAYSGYVVAFYVIDLAYLAAGKTFVIPTVSVHFGMSIVAILFIALNPLFEEVMVRGYLMSEILALTGKGWVAVLLSVVLQAVYHLYQGVTPALMYAGLFFVYSLYFLQTKRIWPVILSHFYFDALTLIYYR